MNINNDIPDDSDLIRTIKSASEEQKPIVYFTELDKGLVLNNVCECAVGEGAEMSPYNVIATVIYERRHSAQYEGAYKFAHGFSVTLTQYVSDTEPTFFILRKSEWASEDSIFADRELLLAKQWEAAEAAMQAYRDIQNFHAEHIAEYVKELEKGEQG